MELCDFGWILNQLRMGKIVGRRGWNGKGMWLALVSGDQWGLGSGVPYDTGHERQAVALDRNENCRWGIRPLVGESDRSPR